MRFSCAKKGEVDKFYMDGYSSVASLTKSATNRDLEGITFVIESPKGDNLTAENISIQDSRNKDYLDKFTNIREQIAEGITGLYEKRLGYLEFLHPDEDIQGEYYTLIVDKIFVPDINEFEGLTGIFDSCVEVHLVDGYDENLSAYQFCEEMIEDAKKANAESIRFCGVSNLELRKPLEKQEFDVEVENRQLSAERELH